MVTEVYSKRSYLYNEQIRNNIDAFIKSGYDKLTCNEQGQWIDKQNKARVVKVEKASNETSIIAKVHAFFIEFRLFVQFLFQPKSKLKFNAALEKFEEAKKGSDKGKDSASVASSASDSSNASSALPPGTPDPKKAPPGAPQTPFITGKTGQPKPEELAREMAEIDTFTAKIEPLCARVKEAMKQYQQKEDVREKSVGRLLTHREKFKELETEKAKLHWLERGKRAENKTNWKKAVSGAFKELDNLETISKDKDKEDVKKAMKDGKDDLVRAIGSMAKTCLDGHVDPKYNPKFFSALTLAQVDEIGKDIIANMANKKLLLQQTKEKLEKCVIGSLENGVVQLGKKVEQQLEKGAVQLEKDIVQVGKSVEQQLEKGAVQLEKDIVQVGKSVEQQVEKGASQLKKDAVQFEKTVEQQFEKDKKQLQTPEKASGSEKQAPAGKTSAVSAEKQASPDKVSSKSSVANKSEKLLVAKS